MYLEHFGINQYPFTLTPNTEFYYNSPAHQAALNVLLFSLRSGEGFIKIVGEVGSGKTLLCRKLLDILQQEFITAYIPNPNLSPMDFRKTFARELGIELSEIGDQSDLSQAILERLMDLHAIDQRILLIVDEAQTLPDESLEAIRLLTNLETQSEKLIQIVLFGQPELDERLKQHHLRQLNQRITFSHQLKFISKDHLEDYLYYRLSVAGYKKGPIFKKKAVKLIFEFSEGIPRVINILSHKAMLVAYGRGETRITKRAVIRAIEDSKGIVRRKRPWLNHLLKMGSILIIMILLTLVLVYLMKQGY